ncbi:hypothetical protein J2Y46_002356 [Microbacterium sp. BE35]|uniref:hypothetical protein n=1 Tax=Microbacterium sp. BE35 TaxID=2817773 RepID=UPI0028550F16|nr:hypothetical protein [Microbacterium sp. BE35]MDR7189530.1 hypothetical protein [Microbacterium sp. BE35]
MRRTLVVLAVLIMSLAVAGPAAAAPGDTISDPIPITGTLPVAIPVDNTGATGQAWNDCWDPFPNAIYYSFTATQPVFVTIADNPALKLVHAVYRADGTYLRDSFCTANPSYLLAGEYLIAVASFPQVGDYVTGSGTLSITAAPPPVEALNFTVTGTTVNTKTGYARATFEFDCNIASTYHLYPNLTQKVPKSGVINKAEDFQAGSCTPGVRVRQTAVFVGVFAFKTGTAVVNAELDLYASENPTGDFEFMHDQIVKLSNSHT